MLQLCKINMFLIFEKQSFHLFSFLIIKEKK
jgi:hypothetical protein